MRRPALAVALLVAVALAAPASAVAQQELKLHPKAPVAVWPGAPVTARLKVKDMTAAPTLLCIDFQFEGDLLDPGETLLVDLGASLGAFGSVNVTEIPQATINVCTAQPEHLAAFSDGREWFEIGIEAGSATIVSATILVAGA